MITCVVVSFNVVFSVDTSCRIEPHVQKDFFLCIVFFALFVLRCIVDDCELGDVSAYNSAARSSPSVPFLETEVVLLSAHLCLEIAK